MTKDLPNHTTNLRFSAWHVRSPCSMNNILKFRFLAAAMSVSVGCYAMFAHWPDPGMFFCLVLFATMSRSDYKRPMPRREVLVFVAGVLVLGIVLGLSKWIFPNSWTAELQKVTEHPAFVLPLWLVFLWILHQVYRQQKQELKA